MTLKTQQHIRYILSLLFVGLLCNGARAQCTLSLAFDDTLCQGDTMNLGFSGSGYTQTVWDLCAGDLALAPTATNMGNINGAFNYPNSINFVKDGDNWYGFVKNLNLSVFYRLNFGNSPRNTPTLDTISFSPTSTTLNTSSWGKVDIIKDGANWYGFTVLDNNRLLRINFGSTLTSSSVSYDLYTNPFSLLSTPRDLSVVKDANGYHVIVMNVLSNNISVINLGSSVQNSPQSGYNITALSGLSTSSQCLTCVNDCGNFIAFVGGLGTNNICRVNFGSAINNAPAVVQLGSNGDFQKPNFIRFTQENGKWYAFVKALSPQGIYKLDFGNSLLNSPQSTVMGGFSGLITSAQSYGLDIANDSSSWTIIAMNASTGNQRFVRLDFPDDCSFGQPLLSGQNVSAPTSASDSGIVNFSVSTTGSDGYLYQSAGSFVILSKPYSAFSYEGVCFGDTTFLTNMSTPVQEIASLTWNINGNTTGQENPNLIFPDTGNYPVSLVVTNTNGCSDVASANIEIHPLPNAVFDPDTTCALAAVDLNDGSFVNGDVISSWSWVFNQTDTVELTEPGYSFDSAGTYNISLTVMTSHGCLDMEDHDVTIRETPALVFSIDGTCLGDTTFFDNATQFGSGTVDYLWEFGDGGYSTDVSPTHVYPDTGNYPFSVYAFGSNGCADSISMNVSVGFAPVANFGIQETLLCSKSPIQFIDSSTVVGGSLNAWSWDFGDSLNSLSQDPVHFFDSAGTYEVTLTAYSGTACYESVTKSFTVLGSPEVGFGFLGNCFGDTVQFTDSTEVPGTDEIDTWAWDFGGDNTSSLQNPQYYFNAQNSYPVLLTVVAASGCFSNAMDTVTIYGPATATIVHGTDTLCTDLGVPLQSTSTVAPEDSIVKYNWEVIWETTPVYHDSVYKSIFIPAETGQYTVALSITTRLGCTSSAHAGFSIKKSPELQLTVEDVCFGDATQFTDNYSGTNYSWSWSFGDDATSALDDPSHVFPVPGNYLSTLLLTDKSNGCFDTISYNLGIVPLPTIRYSTDNLCTGTPVQFTDSSFSEGDTVTRWEWQFVNIDTSYMQNPVITFPDSNLYTLRVHVESQKGCSNDLVDFLKPKASPKVGFDISPRFGVPPLEVTFTGDQSEGVFYEWSFGDGDSATGRVQKHVFTETGEYPVQLNVMAANGCSGVALSKVIVDDLEADVSVEALNVIEVGDFLEFEVLVRNLSGVTVEGFDIIVQVPSQGTVMEHFEAVLLFGDFYTARLSTRLMNTGTGYEMACAEVILGGNYAESRLDNNKHCISTKESFTVFDLFPNPSENFINTYVNTGEKTTLEIQVEDMQGRLERVETLNLEPGMTLVSMDISLLLKGVHVVRISNGSEVVSQRIVKL